MNREIKFRAWLYDEKQMIFSNDQASTDSCEVWILYEGGLKVQTQETIWREQGGETIERIEYVDCQHSIMQFTGLTDKNGKEIFEGDIVRWCLGKHYWEAVIATVPNNKSNTLYAMETFHNCTTDLTNECYTYERSNSRNGIRNDIEYLSERVEIIGNIHETPELLK